MIAHIIYVTIKKFQLLQKFLINHQANVSKRIVLNTSHGVLFIATMLLKYLLKITSSIEALQMKRLLNVVCK